VGFAATKPPQTCKAENRHAVKHDGLSRKLGYFASLTTLAIIQDGLRVRFAQFKLRAHFFASHTVLERLERTLDHPEKGIV